MRFPKSFYKFTPLSKLIALVLFIALPFIGFYLGTYYQKHSANPDSSQNIPTQKDETSNRLIVKPDVPLSNDNKQTIISLTTDRLQKRYPTKKITIESKTITEDKGWAQGIASIYTPNTESGEELMLFLAYWKNDEWHIFLESDPEYPVLFQQLPDSVINKEIKDFYKNRK